MKVAVGSDQFGYALKENLKAYLIELGHEPVDFGCLQPEDAFDYPDVAIAVSDKIAQGEFERGILVCGTGIGMAMTANKVAGVRAACCHDPYSAERSRKSNDAQIMTMGAEIVGPALGRYLIDIWLASEFGGGRSTRKVDKIKQLDERKRNSLASGR